MGPVEAMRPFTSLAFLALLAIATAIPITPSGLEHQRLVERLRSEGVSEVSILDECLLKSSDLASTTLKS